MRKSTLFISAAITTFMLAIIFGVASAYQKILQTGGVPSGAAQQQEVMIGTSSNVAGAVTIEQAADVASNVIGRTDLYAAENAQLNGVDAYLVTFSSGDLVYVGLDGKIISISKLPATYILSQKSSNGGGGGNGGGDTSSVAPVAPAAPVVVPAAPAAPVSGGGDEGGDD